MRRSSMVLGTLASLAAPVVGVMAYNSWAPGPASATDTPAGASSHVGSTTTPVVRYRPCVGASRLEDGACVTHRVKMVVAPLPNSDPAPADLGPAPPSTDASPAHPIHPLPTHQVDPGDDPTGEPTAEPPAGPTAGPSAPSCEESDDDEAGEPGETEDAEESEPSEPNDGGFFGRMAALVGDPDLVPVNASDSDCEDHHDNGDDNGGDEDHAQYGDAAD